MSDFNTGMGCHVWKGGQAGGREGRREGRWKGRKEGRQVGGKAGRKAGRKEKPAGITTSTPLHSGWLKGNSKKQFF